MRHRRPNRAERDDRRIGDEHVPHERCRCLLGHADPLPGEAGQGVEGRAGRRRAFEAALRLHGAEVSTAGALGAMVNATIGRRTAFRGSQMATGQELHVRLRPFTGRQRPESSRSAFQPPVRTTRTFPSRPPPQKKRVPSEASPLTTIPGSSVCRSRTSPVSRSTRRRSETSSSDVACQSASPVKVTPVC